MATREKIGLLGGTFNPIHFGHLRAAEEVREILCLSKVYFIPASIPPHKDSTNIAPSEDRLRMLELAIKDNPFFEISDVELKRRGPSYTIDTLRYFSTEFPDFEFYFIVGTDLFSEIDTWKDYKKLFKVSNFAVISRPGFPKDFSKVFPLALREDFRYHKEEGNIIFYLHKSLNILAFVRIEGIQISSTKIRCLLKENKSIKYLVPKEVEEYIITKKLYKEEGSL